MPCESEFVEISMMVEISGKNFLGIISLLVGLLDVLIIFLISDRKISESAVVLGKRTCQREVMGSFGHPSVPLPLSTPLKRIFTFFSEGY